MNQKVILNKFDFIDYWFKYFNIKYLDQYHIRFQLKHFPTHLIILLLLGQLNRIKFEEIYTYCKSIHIYLSSLLPNFYKQSIIQ